MHEVEAVLFMLVLVAALAWVATRLGVAYPILLVVGGLLIGWATTVVPHLPNVALDPGIVFVLFLPPLLYYGGLTTSWRDFRANIRPITLLAVGLVLFTTVVVAAIAHAFIPGFAGSWPAAFALGAIISPPDAVAASAIVQRLRVPKRIVTILEGESAVNDATALVAYKFAVAAATATAAFSLPMASAQFVWVAAGGIGVGLVVGWLAARVWPHLGDTGVEGIVSLLVPFVAYLPAEWIGVSGVLAAVAAGLVMARQIPRRTTARMRLRGYALWESVVFLMNGLIFILIGLQLPEVVASLRTTESVGRLVGYGALISVAAIAVRLLWVFPATYVPRLLLPKLAASDPAPPWRMTFIIGWTGMRGIVSLAAALALPAAFPARDLILFITFCVILATLVLQGLSLPPIIRRFGLTPDDDDEQEELTARHATAVAVLQKLGEMEAAGVVSGDLATWARTTYDDRVRYLVRQLLGADGDGNGAPIGAPDCDTREVLERQLLQIERDQLLFLRDQNVISDEVMRKVQSELDLEESRLDGAV